MKQKDSFHMNVGGASMLLMLAIFALTVFAVLSLRASYHELKMAEKTKDSVEAYYKADSKAESIYSNIQDFIVSEPLDLSINRDRMVEALKTECQVSFDEKGGLLTYTVPIDYNKFLEVKLMLTNKTANKVKVYSWKMVTDTSDDYDTGRNEFWNGNIWSE